MISLYLNDLKDAIIFFPFVALIFTIPYMIYCYNRYGSLIFFRILIVYSFIFYLICCYFLIILPLPSFEQVEQMTSPTTQLIPFMFVFDIIKEQKDATSFFTNRAVLQVTFNALMFVPFGMFLHYYFRCSLKKTVKLSFFLSLFFEITQLSGLYFIYSRGYRIFDLDDLLINTFGGYLGYLAVIPLMKLLPSRQKIDEDSFIASFKISWIRRLLCIIIDFIGLLVVNSIVSLICHKLKITTPNYVIVSFISIVLFTIKTKGKSLGMYATKVRIINDNYTVVTPLSIFKRYLWLFIFFYVIPSCLMGVLEFFLTYDIIDDLFIFAFDASIFIYYVVTILYSFIEIVKRKSLLYEAISKTKIVSSK